MEKRVIGGDGLSKLYLNSFSSSILECLGECGLRATLSINDQGPLEGHSDGIKYCL